MPMPLCHAILLSSLIHQHLCEFSFVFSQPCVHVAIASQLTISQSLKSILLWQWATEITLFKICCDEKQIIWIFKSFLRRDVTMPLALLPTVLKRKGVRIRSIPITVLDFCFAKKLFEDSYYESKKISANKKGYVGMHGWSRPTANIIVAVNVCA